MATLVALTARTMATYRNRSTDVMGEASDRPGEGVQQDPSPRTPASATPQPADENDRAYKPGEQDDRSTERQDRAIVGGGFESQIGYRAGSERAQVAAHDRTHSAGKLLAPHLVEHSDMGLKVGDDGIAHEDDEVATPEHLVGPRTHVDEREIPVEHACVIQAYQGRLNPGDGGDTGSNTVLTPVIRGSYDGADTTTPRQFRRTGRPWQPCAPLPRCRRCR
jgi:hypothetical protein